MLYLKYKIENGKKVFSPGLIDPGKCQVPGILRHSLSVIGKAGDCTVC